MMQSQGTVWEKKSTNQENQMLVKNKIESSNTPQKKFKEKITDNNKLIIKGFIKNFRLIFGTANILMHLGIIFELFQLIVTDK
jgi:hypothetical protein